MVFCEWRVLSGPAILRISVLLLIAGALAALVQYLLPAVPEPVAEPPAVARSAPPEPVVQPPAAELPVRPEPPAAPAPAARPAEVSPPAPAPERRAGTPATGDLFQMPSDALAFPPAPPGRPAPAPPGEAEVVRAEDAAGPRAVALVDLNTASVADLNRLQGGGTIGRAIVAKRPYASVDQLLSKRVLSRAVYDRIREQVTVR